jgi:methyltransferase (TIGR00027 family)
MDAVGSTGLLVAAIRAEESQRPDRLFSDPYADILARETGRAALRRYRAASGSALPIIEVRTRWYDDALQRELESGIGQCVILAAGMDTRAFRLGWPAGARVFEVDRPAIIAAKESLLIDAAPRCVRVTIGTDLEEDWGARLQAREFDPAAPTVWLVEGVLQYLEQGLVRKIFERIEALSATRSVCLYDIVGKLLLDSPAMAATLQMMRDFGAPWIFGTDTPAALQPGWDACVEDIAEVGNRLGRWPFPAAPRDALGVPRGYFVTARRL